MTSSIYSTITIFRGLYIYIYLHMHILYCIFLYIEFTAGHSRAANLRPTTLRSPGSTNRKVGPWRPQLSWTHHIHMCLDMVPLKIAITLWLCQNSYWKWPSRNSEFSHEKWCIFPVRYVSVYQMVNGKNKEKLWDLGVAYFQTIHWLNHVKARIGGLEDFANATRGPLGTRHV